LGNTVFKLSYHSYYFSPQVSAPDDAGWTPLFFACQYGQYPVVQLLISAGAETNAQGSDGVNALYLAVQNGHILIVEELILADTSIDVPSTDGVTSLYCAAQHGDLEMVQLLLFNNANANYEDERGLIPLHMACLNGHRKVVEFLVKAGSDIDHESKQGVTPIELADQNGHEELVEILRDNGARLPGERSPYGHGWGAYFKQVLTKAWTQSIRTLDLPPVSVVDGPEKDVEIDGIKASSDERARGRRVATETVTITKEEPTALTLTTRVHKV